MCTSNAALCLPYCVGEPPHIYGQREWSVAKFWLEPVAFVTNRGFRAGQVQNVL